MKLSVFLGNEKAGSLESTDLRVKPINLKYNFNAFS